MSDTKRRLGDRKDGKLLRDIDSMHIIMPMIYINRSDNEAYISERIDLTNIDAYLAKRNAENPEFKFTLFHIIVAAILKVIVLRPKLNRFIANKNMYQRNDLSAAFVVKKQFNDTSEEGMQQWINQYALEYAVQLEVMNQKAAELGLDQFTDEEKAEIEKENADEWAEIVDTYVSYYGGLTEESTDEEKASARISVLSMLEGWGYTEAIMLENAFDNAVLDRVEAYIEKIVKEDSW